MTSVQWMIDELIKKHVGKVGNEYIEIFEKAKEMHKKEIIDAWNGGDYAYFYSKETGRDFADGSEYYQETFGSKGNATSDFDKPFMDFAKQYFKSKKD